MGAATHYDSYQITVSGGSVSSIAGSPTDSNVGLTDDAGTGGQTTVLGDVPNDPFAVGSTSGYIFEETATWAGGTGFIASFGGSDYLFVTHGSTPPSNGTPLTLTAAPGSNGSGEWTINGPHTGIGCFFAGTMIATPSGEQAVETLAAGDLVLTASGQARPVQWLGRSTVSTRFADPVRVLPIRIMAGALAENVPARDLLVSPGHAVLVDDVLVHAGALVNGTSIVRETGVAATFSYYHVELASHDVLLADGALAESFLEGNEEMDFLNWGERPAAASKPEELRFPRAKAARQVPRATRERIAARATALVPDLAVAA